MGVHQLGRLAPRLCAYKFAYMSILDKLVPPHSCCSWVRRSSNISHHPLGAFSDSPRHFTQDSGLFQSKQSYHSRVCFHTGILSHCRSIVQHSSVATLCTIYMMSITCYLWKHGHIQKFLSCYFHSITLKSHGNCFCKHINLIYLLYLEKGRDSFFNIPMQNC